MFVWTVLVFLEQMAERRKNQLTSTRPVGFAASNKVNKPFLYWWTLLQWMSIPCPLANFLIRQCVVAVQNSAELKDLQIFWKLSHHPSLTHSLTRSSTCTAGWRRRASSTLTLTKTKLKLSASWQPKTRVFPSTLLNVEFPCLSLPPLHISVARASFQQESAYSSRKFKIALNVVGMVGLCTSISVKVN